MEQEPGVGGQGGGTENVDALVDQAYQSNDYEIPMNEASSTESQAIKAAIQEFKLKGKDGEFSIRGDDPRVTQWLQQGRDYARLNQEWKAKESEWQKKLSAAEHFKNTYGPIDQWATQNPDQWARFTQEFQKLQENPDAYGQSGGLNNNEVDPRIAQLQQHFKNVLEPLQNQVKELVTERQHKQIEAEDRMLDEEITSVRKQYAGIDWNSPNNEGKTLEQQVLEHAHKNGIKSFNTAFRDFYHDNLVRMAEERGKESLSKDMQKRTRLGLLGESSTPPKQRLTEARGIKSKSYDDLLTESLEELGIAN